MNYFHKNWFQNIMKCFLKTPNKINDTNGCFARKLFSYSRGTECSPAHFTQMAEVAAVTTRKCGHIVPSLFRR